MPPPRDSTVLRFTGLSRAYGRLQVLRDLAGEVVAGQALLVTGANGSGKSTLLRCLAGLLAPQRGTIECRIDGRSLDTVARRRAVGYAAPDLALYPELSCIENLRFFARLRQVPARAGERLLEALGLPPERLAGALSSGMLQRLRWAWALLHAPRVLLLDEPYANLDARGRDQVTALLRRHLERGLAVIANPETLELPDVAAHLRLDG